MIVLSAAIPDNLVAALGGGHGTKWINSFNQSFKVACRKDFPKELRQGKTIN